MEITYGGTVIYIISWRAFILDICVWRPGGAVEYNNAMVSERRCAHMENISHVTIENILD